MIGSLYGEGYNMAECKSCGMTFDPEDYRICPYCGDESLQDKSVGSDEPSPDSANEIEGKIAPAKKLPPKKIPGSKKDKPAGSRIKYLVIGLIAVAAIAVAISANFASEDSAITVPDKYSTIQEAIDAAEDGEEIIVDIGIYRENIDFKGKNITLRSTDPDNLSIVEQTIIHGGGSGIVVYFGSGESDQAVLSGFSIIRGSGIAISGGSSPVIEKNIIEDNTAEYGAGIAIFDSSPSIVNNTISRNSGSLGGGLFIEKSSPLVEGNTISMNRATNGGGMVIISNSSPQVVNNSIVDNRGTRSGGGIIVASDSTPTIRGNVISGNGADQNGGGLYIEESEPLVENNTIAENRAINGGGIFIINTLSTALLISGNNIAENLALVAGGGTFMRASSPTFDDNTFFGNISERFGGGAAVYNSLPVFRRNVYEENEAKEAEGGGAIWVSLDSELDLEDPDTNSYLLNKPNDIYIE